MNIVSSFLKLLEEGFGKIIFLRISADVTIRRELRDWVAGYQRTFAIH